jgi:hypothetical protein
MRRAANDATQANLMNFNITVSTQPKGAAPIVQHENHRQCI